MTREEALKILDTIPTIGEQVDALEMAIKVLEQKPILDKIRAEIGHLQIYYLYSHNDLVERHEVFEIIDKYKAEREE